MLYIIVHYKYDGVYIRLRRPILLDYLRLLKGMLISGQFFRTVLNPSQTLLKLLYLCEQVCGR